MAVMKTPMPNTHASAIAPMAILELSRLLGLVNKTITANANSGNTGISQAS
jgi:hypothetical protein